MDKTFAFMLIIGLTITALCITISTIEAAVKNHYKNAACKRAMFGFTSLMWIFIIALTTIIVIY